MPTKSREKYFLEVSKEKGLSPVEEAVLRRYVGARYDELQLPTDENERNLSLCAAFIRCGERYPADPCGMCEEVFDKPTIVVDETNPPARRICVQWRGRVGRGDLPPEMQFRFPLLLEGDAENERWLSSPQSFTVAYLGSTAGWDPRWPALDIAKLGPSNPIIVVRRNFHRAGMGRVISAAAVAALQTEAGLVGLQHFKDDKDKLFGDSG